MVTRRKSSSSARRKKVTLPFYAEPRQYEALKSLSARTRVPQQVYLREALDGLLAKYETAEEH